MFTLWSSVSSQVGVGIYPLGALLNHDCAPNCMQRFGPNRRVEFRWGLRWEFLVGVQNLGTWGISVSSEVGEQSPDLKSDVIHIF